MAKSFNKWKKTQLRCQDHQTRTSWNMSSNEKLKLNYTLQRNYWLLKERAQMKLKTSLKMKEQNLKKNNRELNLEGTKDLIITITKTKTCLTNKNTWKCSKVLSTSRTIISSEKLLIKNYKRKKEYRDYRTRKKNERKMKKQRKGNNLKMKRKRWWRRLLHSSKRKYLIKRKSHHERVGSHQDQAEVQDQLNPKSCRKTMLVLKKMERMKTNLWNKNQITTRKLPKERESFQVIQITVRVKNQLSLSRYRKQFR